MLDGMRGTLLYDSFLFTTSLSNRMVDIRGKLGDQVQSKGHEKKDLGVHMAIIGGPKIMTKKNAHHFLKALVMGQSVQQTYTMM